MRSLFDINEKPEVVNIVDFSLNFLVAKVLRASVRWNMRASVSWNSLSCIAVSLANGGKITGGKNGGKSKSFSQTKFWLLLIRVNPIKIGCAVSPDEYLINSYTKCPKIFSLQTRATSKVACNSSFGTVVTLIGTTRAFPKRNASSIFPFPVGIVTQAPWNETAVKKSLGTDAKHMQFWVIKGSSILTSRAFDVYVR